MPRFYDQIDQLEQANQYRDRRSLSEHCPMYCSMDGTSQNCAWNEHRIMMRWPTKSIGA
jgi:hypothetical protein